MACRRKSTQPAAAAAALAALVLAGCGNDSAAPRAGCADRALLRPATRDDGAALRAIEAKRAAFRASIARAPGEAARGATRREAAGYIERALVDSVLPRWNGTRWAFHGTSTTPGEGEIACGYFVSTTLGEAGFHVERARLAQQPAEAIIKTLVPPEAITRFSDVPVAKFTAAVAARGDGLYVIGLDNHVGFLIVRSGEVSFHHASYVPPAKVTRERAASSAPLVDSRYRVIGKLFTDDALIDAWLDGAPIPTKVARPAAPR